MKLHRILAEGGAISDVTDVMTGDTYLDAVLVHVSTAPTTSEYFSITVESVAGSAYDTVLYRIDLSAASTTDIVLTPSDLGLPLLEGDALRTAYANTDGRTIGATYLLR